MSWEALAASSEGIGALGVILTLLYLSRQVSQNTIALRVQSYNAITNQFRSWNAAFRADPRLVGQFVNQLESIEDLDQLDRQHAIHIFFDFFKLAENLHYQYRQGMIDESMWSGWKNFFTQYLSAPGAVWYWERRPDFFAPEFREWVESVIASRPESRRHGRIPGGQGDADAQPAT